MGNLQMLPVVLGLVRHGLTLAAGWLVAQGYLDNDAASQLVGALVAVAGVLWSVRDKAASKPSAPAATEQSDNFPL